MNILMWLESFDGTIPTPAILKPKQLWTGKQVFSLIIPRNTNFLNMEDEEPDMSHTDTKVLIEEGELISGIQNKKSLGTSHKSLVHVIWSEHGPEVCKHFLNQVQHVVNYWLLHHGFSVGVGDTIADEETLAKITQTIRKAKVHHSVSATIRLESFNQEPQDQVNECLIEAQRGALERQPGRTMMESFEFKINQILNKARDDAGSSAQKSLKRSNNFKAMVVAGSKGSAINISQVLACVGQQNVEGKRIPFCFR